MRQIVLRNKLFLHTGASAYRTYLVAVVILATIVATIKFYRYASDVIRQRTAAAALEAKKAREKLESKKIKRK
jgi:hypothetical protein